MGSLPLLLRVKTWSLADVVGGVTVAATSLPQYVAYAELAGLAGYQGLTTSGPPIMAFAFITSSPSLCIGVTSISALMSFSMLHGAEYKESFGDERWQDLLGTWSALVGVTSMLLAFCGASKLARRIPSSVQKGWTLGFATTVVAAQMGSAVFHSSGAAKKLCILPSLWSGGPVISGGAAAMYRLGWMLAHPFAWDPDAAALAALTLFILLCCSSFLKRLFRLPGIDVIIATVIGTILAMQLEYQGNTVGAPPVAPTSTSSVNVSSLLTSWIRLWPWEMPWAELFARLGGIHMGLLSAVAFACVDFLAILSVVPEGPTTELLGQGAACVVSGMAGAAPIGGSLSRSLVAGMLGCSSPLMGFVSGVTTLVLAFPQVGGLLAPTPKAVLAAVVLAAVLPGVVWPKKLLQLRGTDALVAWGTAVSSCIWDPTVGFGAGLVMHAAFNLSFKRIKTE